MINNEERFPLQTSSSLQPPLPPPPPDGGGRGGAGGLETTNIPTTFLHRRTPTSSGTSSNSNTAAKTFNDEDGRRYVPHYSGDVLFPWKLHQMLDAADSDGFTSVVSWLSDYKSYKVHDKETFTSLIMPKFFDGQTKYKSFQRQLNMWGFQRHLFGPCRGGYTHEHFVKGLPSLCCRMTRSKTSRKTKSPSMNNTNNNKMNEHNNKNKKQKQEEKSEETTNITSKLGSNDEREKKELSFSSAKEAMTKTGIAPPTRRIVKNGVPSHRNSLKSLLAAQLPPPTTTTIALPPPPLTLSSSSNFTSFNGTKGMTTSSQQPQQQQDERTNPSQSLFINDHDSNKSVGVRMEDFIHWNLGVNKSFGCTFVGPTCVATSTPAIPATTTTTAANEQDDDDEEDDDEGSLEVFDGMHFFPTYPQDKFENYL